MKHYCLILILVVFTLTTFVAPGAGQVYVYKMEDGTPLFTDTKRQDAEPYPAKKQKPEKVKVSRKHEYLYDKARDLEVQLDRANKKVKELEESTAISEAELLLAQKKIENHRNLRDIFLCALGISALLWLIVLFTIGKRAQGIAQRRIEDYKRWVGNKHSSKLRDIENSHGTEVNQLKQLHRTEVKRLEHQIADLWKQKKSCQVVYNTPQQTYVSSTEDLLHRQMYGIAYEVYVMARLAAMNFDLIKYCEHDDEHNGIDATIGGFNYQFKYNPDTVSPDEAHHYGRYGINLVVGREPSSLTMGELERYGVFHQVMKLPPIISQKISFLIRAQQKYMRQAA